MTEHTDNWTSYCPQQRENDILKFFGKLRLADARGFAQPVEEDGNGNKNIP